jgi:hypothetical protein
MVLSFQRVVLEYVGREPIGHGTGCRGITCRDHVPRSRVERANSRLPRPFSPSLGWRWDRMCCLLAVQAAVRARDVSEASRGT